MEFIEADLPYPPALNTYWRHCLRKSGAKSFVKVYLSQQAKDYKKSVSKYFALRTKTLPYDRLYMEVYLYPPRINGDIDGRLKGLLDALQEAGVYDDDFKVWSLYVERKEKVKGGLCRIRISEHKETCLDPMSVIA